MRKHPGLQLPALLFIALFSSSILAQDRQPNVRSREIKFDLSVEAIKSGTLISEPIAVPMEDAKPFLAVGAAWLANEDAKLSIRGSVDGIVWSGWLSAVADSDSANERGEGVSPLLLFDPQTRFVQYRMAGEQIDLKSLRLVFISPDATPRQMQERIEQRASEAMSTENLQQQQMAKYPKPPIVTRTEWGCPDGQITTHGSLSYTTVTHLIVHHTFSPSTAANGDWAALVRSIWNFHVFSNGWADIGYNYLIDQTGVIYEGRAGGDNVVGAHFCGTNAGTMGVVIIGDFTNAPPPPPALNSLKKILAWKADQRGIDPVGRSRHASSDRDLNHISGHRDGCSTACPGEAFYPLLPGIRTEVKALLSNVGAVASVSAASFNGAALAGESIVAAFGENLASSIQVGSSTPLPNSLAGTTVTVRDSANAEKIARLFFVSPGQVNFLMPEGLAKGAATVIVTNGEGKLAAGTTTIAAIAPSLFAANANGRDVPAAVVLRIKANGSQGYEPVATFDQTQNKFVAAPIDLGPESEQVFLVAYGTGVRGRSSLGAVEAKIGGVSSEILYAGIATGYFGLDQINVRLSRSLIGRGDVDFELTADGAKANVLKLRIR